MTRKKRRALLCMLAVPLLALAPRSGESLPASAAEPAAVPEKYVALTFDDGPWPETTEQLLDGLAERGAKATFFLIGEQIAGHEDTVRRMADEGHQVGSHTFTHMDLSRGDPAERLREIAATDETLRALLGDGVYWLRPPWGFLAPQTAAAVEVPMVYWSLDTEDWRRLDADAVAHDIIDHARDGDIILLHDPYATSVEAALRAIDALTPQGYRFVTLEELFRQKGVEPEPGKALHPSRRAQADRVRQRKRAAEARLRQLFSITVCRICAKNYSMLRTSVRTMNAAPTHLVARASLASMLLALFFAIKESATPPMAPLRPADLPLWKSTMPMTIRPQMS